MKSKVLMIAGPTAVGKTALSIRLAKQFGGEVISGDSMQIYRHLDIGTAKVTPEEMAGVPHYLINNCDVTQRYTVYDFKTQANQLITAMTDRKVLPIIAGGTGFYLNALSANLNLGDHLDSDVALKNRQKWTDYYEEVGPEAAWQRLKQLDPNSAAKISVHNPRRIIRALEVINETDQLFSEQTQNEPNLDCLIIGLNTNRALLYDRINQRVDQFLKQGLEAEARWLYDRRDSSPQASRGIGYKELFMYFDNEITLPEAIELIKRNSRHFAKRQLTYFRNQLTVNWFDPFADDLWYDKVSDLVTQWLN
ncbi:tRNA (adenosine(37)-N6)-dimethylallyltransferase MiaA [Agrilactobacillus yilanensis]|uniref:tRNA dimethylallyltransferase n=1 Tax=Agrilactobacillus yilanensis TaxID=2485997 RepID=A0ABW4J993_9LACO|nr:tRNA (adenosine(37)-N6)-dimethylallyltransferase MiaA [Agrilactobacillus yilanensis]